VGKVGSRMTRYYKQKDGEWVKPTMRGYLIKCCQCGSTHRLDFKIQGKRLVYRATRLK
jgi:hypothetical protein